MKKAALELSLNFIITTILGLVIFFGIVVLNRNIFVETIDMQDTLDAETERELRDVFRISSEDFIVPFRTQKASSGDVVSYGVALRNVFNNSDCNQINLTVHPGSNDLDQISRYDYCGSGEYPIGFDPNNDWDILCSFHAEIGSTTIEDWIFAGDNTFGPFDIEQGELETFPIVFSLPEEDIPRGVYFFVLEISNNNNECYTDVYGDIIIYIDVE